MRSDILNKEDIELVVKTFYEKIKADNEIGFFFSKVVAMNWEQHMPKMCAFWENILFFTGEYEGNPLIAHRKINQQYTTTTAHFNKWILLFDETINELFSGANAEKMKAHAKSIAAVMLQKI